MKFEVYGNMLRQERHEIEASSADEAIKLIEQREHGAFQSIDAVRDEEGYGWSDQEE